MEDQKRPDGTVHGSDLPDKGKLTGVTDTYGGNLNTGFTKMGQITNDTQSDPGKESD